MINANAISVWPPHAAQIRAVLSSYIAIEYSAREGWGRDTGGVRGQRGGKRWR